jgi:hypothetical protein
MIIHYIDSKVFFAMVALDVHDHTDEKLLALEPDMGTEKKKTSRKTKQLLKAYRYRL